jgi:hypothetical protein
MVNEGGALIEAGLTELSEVLPYFMLSKKRFWG